jgi:hypothetical protein
VRTLFFRLQLRRGNVDRVMIRIHANASKADALGINLSHRSLATQSQNCEMYGTRASTPLIVSFTFFNFPVLIWGTGWGLSTGNPRASLSTD